MGWPSGWIEWATSIQTATTVLAFPIGALALWYAYNQLRDTKLAAEAARDSAVDAQANLLRARLMMQLALVRQVETDLGESRRDSDLKGVLRALRRWRIIAATSAAAVNELGGTLGGEIAVSIELARIAERRIEDEPAADITKATSRVTRAISEMSDRITMHAEGLAVQIPPTGDEPPTEQLDPVESAAKSPEPDTTAETPT